MKNIFLRLKNSFYVDLLLGNENLAKGAPQSIMKFPYGYGLGYIKLCFGVFPKLININICIQFHSSMAFRTWLVYRCASNYPTSCSPIKRGVGQLIFFNEI